MTAVTEVCYVRVNCVPPRGCIAGANPQMLLDPKKPHLNQISLDLRTAHGVVCSQLLGQVDW